MKKQDLAKKIEVALLKPETTAKQILNACKKVKKHQFGAFVVNQIYVHQIKKELAEEKNIRVVSVIDFPFGAGGISTKLAQAEFAYEDGADDLDVVINIGALKSKKYSEVSRELRMIKYEYPKITLKAIIETALLTKKEIGKATEICKDHGADYIKTNTGFFQRTRNLVDEVKIIRKYTHHIKASAGIRSYDLIEELEKLDVKYYGIGMDSAIKILKKLK